MVLGLGLSPSRDWDSGQRAAGRAGLMGCPPLSATTLPSLSQLPGGRAWPRITQAQRPAMAATPSEARLSGSSRAAAPESA